MNHGTRLTLNPTASLVPDQYTAAGNGTGVDLAGAESALVSIITGTYGGTTPVAKYKVQESDDNSTFTDVSDDNLIGATGNTSGVTIAASSAVKVDYVGTKRYIRVAISAVTGTTPVIRLGASVILSHLRHTSGQPV
jgi:hypothetical protein